MFYNKIRKFPNRYFPKIDVGCPSSVEDESSDEEDESRDEQTVTNTEAVECFKDGAYYCYCAYVLRISRYSDFLSPMLTNTGIFLRGLKLSAESKSL